ncbi:MAG: hypothetical protein GY787_11765 [Alteromonadales bacterium]|nr:hypothetical protein [Alteromonadales bacterium]
MAYDPKKLILLVEFIDTPEKHVHWARYLTDITGMDAQMANVDTMVKLISVVMTFFLFIQ